MDDTHALHLARRIVSTLNRSRPVVVSVTSRLLVGKFQKDIHPAVIEPLLTLILFGSGGVLFDWW